MYLEIVLVVGVVFSYYNSDAAQKTQICQLFLILACVRGRNGRNGRKPHAKPPSREDIKNQTKNLRLCAFA